MTTTDRPTKRETLSSVRQRGKIRPIIVELRSTWVEIRLKGQRYRYTVTYDAIFGLGAKIAAEALRRERLDRKKERHSA